MQDYARVARGLEEIAGFLQFAGAQRFRAQAYEHAARVVGTVADDLAAVIEQNRLRELDGIGVALARQIDELWNTGTSELLERLRAEHPPGAAELVRVAGLSPRRIAILSKALGIRSVDDLRLACSAGKVRDVSGFGIKTEQRLLDACTRWERERQRQASEPLLLAHAAELARGLIDKLSPRFERACFAGALRRGLETISELDLVVVGSARQAFEDLRALRQVLRVDEARSVALLSEGLPLKIHACESSAWGSTLLGATGDGEHVELLEARAAARSFSLATRSFAEEAPLYAAVGLPFVPPELRHGALELSAESCESWQNLLEVPQVRGLVHCHTTYSDGKQSVLEMAQAAHALGMKYITITDHSPSAHYARGVSLDALKQQWDEIAAAREQVPIAILRGTESDILRDGSLDYPDHVLEQFDVIIASIHARHRMSATEMTARLVRALSLPLFKIWGHGLGRILNRRPPVDCDVPAVLDALAQGGGAVELNADPYRLDLPPEWIPAARKRGIPFVVSVDAHSSRGFGVLPYGVTLARRGGVTAAEVLNTLSADDFCARVRP
jgi:DNA polymerase (family X)